MVPVIISTYPENGSSNAGLKEQIKLTFADAILESTVIASNIKLENTNANDGRDIPLTLEYDSNSPNEITITPADNGYNGNYLIGLTSYRLTVSGIMSPTWEKMQATYSLEFTTITDGIESVISEPVSGGSFSVVNQYPKADSYGVTPSTIKIKFSSNVIEASVTNESVIVTTDTVEDVNDIGFIDINTVAGTVAVGTSADVVVFTPTSALADNTKYTVILKGIQSGTETVDPYMYSFYSVLSPAYTTIADLKFRYPSVAEIIKDSNPIDILEIIRDNSQNAQWIAEQAGTSSDISWNPPDKYVVEYVKTKTRYDIVFDKYLQLAGDDSTKILADLQITYQTDIPALTTLAEQLKQEYLHWEDFLKGGTSGRATPKPFNRGESVDTVPDYKDRSLKDWDGSKSW
jgi:methionine-rich copper-binding protein CopC